MDSIFRKIVKRDESLVVSCKHRVIRLPHGCELVQRRQGLLVVPRLCIGARGRLNRIGRIVQ